MRDKSGIRKNWVTSFEILREKPVILLPFLIIAFLEGLALELIYFSSRNPLSSIAGPIVRKFSGEPFLHYPFNLMKLPRYFYYSRIAIYVFAGVFLTAISINILKNVKSDLPLKANALIKNAAKRYPSFVAFGIIMAFSIFLLQKADFFIFSKLAHLAPKELLSTGIIVFTFFISVVFQVFFILTIPILVVMQKPLLKALAGSIKLGFRHFFSIFTLILVPLLIYFPVTLLNTYSNTLAEKTFPGIVMCVAVLGIIIAAFVECFVVVCATQFLMEKDKGK